MSAAGSVHHTRTGFQAIDCVAYRHVPEAMSFAPAPRDIMLYRIVDYGPTRLTSAERPGEDAELLLLSRGSGRPARGNLAGHRYTIEPNRDLRSSFVPSGADSRIEFGSSAKSINLVFPKGYLASLIEDRAPRHFDPLLFSANPTLIGLISLIELELMRPGLASDLIVEQAMRAMALVLAGIDPHGFIAETERISLSPARLRRVIEYIEANLDAPLMLEQLAQIAGLSVFHFARVFRAATGFSPHHYVIERRMYLAQRLLMMPELPVRDIARACGFARHANFSAAFTRARGTSPSAFRARFAL